MYKLPMCRLDFKPDNDFDMVFVKVVNSKHAGDICSIYDVCNDDSAFNCVYTESTFGLPVILLESTVHDSKIEPQKRFFTGKTADFEAGEIVNGYILRTGIPLCITETLLPFEIKPNDYFYMNFEENKIQKEIGNCKRFLTIKVLQKRVYHNGMYFCPTYNYKVVVLYDQL